MAPPSNRASALRGSTRPVSGWPAMLPERVNCEDGQHRALLATRTAGVRIARAGEQLVDVVERQQPDEVGGVGPVQVDA